MKNRRTILWLSIGLAITVAMHILLSYKGGISTALVKRSCILDQSLITATSINIQHPGERAILLRRLAQWYISSPYSAIADERTILKLLDLMSSTEIEEAIGFDDLLRLGRTKEDYGLAEDDALKVIVTGDKGSSTILFGSLTPAGDGVYTCVNDEPAIYVVPFNILAAVDLKPEGLREKSLIQMWDGAVVGFDIKNGTSEFLRFEKDGDSWMMKGPELVTANAEKIKKLLNALAQTEASDFIWPIGAKGESSIVTASLLASYGLDPDTATTVTLKCVDGIDRQIAFGKSAKDGKVFALVQNAGAIVTVENKLKEEALGGVAEFTDSRLFTTDSASVARISIKDGETSYILLKNENGDWKLDAPIVAEADRKNVESLVSRLLSLKSADIDTEGVIVQFSPNSLALPVSRKAALGDMKLEDFVSKEILSIPPSDVKRIVVSRAHQDSVAVLFDPDQNTWNIERSTKPAHVDEEAVKGVLESISPLNALRIVSLKPSNSQIKEYGLAPGETTLTIAIDRLEKNEVRRNIRIGNSTDGGAFATTGAGDIVFVVESATLANLSAPLIQEKQ